MKKRKSKVFLDANVIIAAVLSPTGGSARLIAEAPQYSFQLFSSKYALAETLQNISDKYPEYLFRYKNLLLEQTIKISPEPSKKFIQKAESLIDVKDVPILASAIESKMDFLITLDKEHFFAPKIKSANLLCDIFTPGDFIKQHF